MTIEIIAFGIAKDIFKKNKLIFEIEEKTTVLSLKKELIKKFPELKKLHSFLIAINEEYAKDIYEIQQDDIVVIIPPVAGG